MDEATRKIAEEYSEAMKALAHASDARTSKLGAEEAFQAEVEWRKANKRALAAQEAFDAAAFDAVAKDEAEEQ